MVRLVVKAVRKLDLMRILLQSKSLSRRFFQKRLVVSSKIMISLKQNSVAPPSSLSFPPSYSIVYARSVLADIMLICIGGSLSMPVLLIDLSVGSIVC